MKRASEKTKQIEVEMFGFFGKLFGICFLEVVWRKKNLRWRFFSVVGWETFQVGLLFFLFHVFFQIC